MQNQRVWSLGLGKWAGLHVRIHMFLLLFVTVTLYLCWSAPSDNSWRTNQWNAAILLAILLGSVLLHELSHAFVTIRLGGDIDEIVLGPTGGLGRVTPLDEPQAEMVAAMAGPMANLAVCLIAAIALAIRGHTDVAGLMSPFSPAEISAGSPSEVFLKMSFWTNWVLVLINAIPAFPFDGRRVVQSMILTGWPHLDEYFAQTFTSRLGKLIGLGCVLLGVFWCFNGNDGNQSVPVWGPLMLFGTFVFFSARKDEEVIPQPKEDEPEHFLGYDFSEGYTSLEKSQTVTAQVDEPSTLAAWIQRRREIQEERQRELEAVEDSRVDEILERLHRDGPESLTADDRATLGRASKRYQKRRSR